VAEDYYKLLGVSKTATADEIKRAYRKLAMQHHPDRAGEGDDKKFKQINEAYQTLSDPNKRAQYDQFGHDGYNKYSQSGGQSSGFGGFSGFGGGESGFSGSGFGFEGGLGDIFEDFFGQAFSQVQAEMRLSPAQAVLGAKMQVNIDGTNVEINIPAGTQDGSSFRIQGGGKAFKGGKKGDLILTVRIEMPKHLTQEQKELWEKLRETEGKKKSWWNG